MSIYSLFSALSFVSVIIYMYVGLYAYVQNRKSLVHKAFLLLCVSFAIWSFAYAFAYVADNPYDFSFWNKISAVGWCSFSAIALYLVLLITGNRFASNKFVIFSIFAPAAGFFYMAVFLFGPDLHTPESTSSFFYVGNFAYNFLYLLGSILILLYWGLKSKSIRIQTQSKILVISGLIPFGLDLLTQTILPFLGMRPLPLMGQIYAVIMILGAYLVISKYSFLKVPEKLLLEEIQDKILDMVIILNSRHEIIRISKNTLNLLHYDENDLIGKNIECFFEYKDREKLKIGYNMEREERFEDIKVIGNGVRIPANLLYFPIFDEKFHDFLGVLLVMQDIRIEHELKLKNELLYEKTIRDSLTNLYNYQYMLETIKDNINLANDRPDYKLSLMMIDIDYFKRVNDTLGHLYGDHVLRTVSAILTDMIQESGYVGRYGGEEFIVLLPYCGVRRAYETAERIRERIESFPFDYDLRITVSIGIKQYGHGSCDQLISSADLLLYKAKENGRNQIAV